MAIGRLSIGVGVGSRISVGGHLVVVKELSHPNLISIAVDGNPDIVVSDQKKEKILPNVFVQTGVGKNGGYNRLLFTAPHEIRINRLEPHRKKAS